jgi:DNA-binding transcriptional ArsR family regulator
VRALADAGLLQARVDGRRRYYRADRTRLGDVAQMLEDMWSDALWKLKLAAELEASRRGPPAGTRTSAARRRPTAALKKRRR